MTIRATERQIQILRYLNDCGDVDLARLCEVVGVTAQTLRTEVSAINRLFAELASPAQAPAPISSGFQAPCLELAPGNVVRVRNAAALPAALVALEASPASDPVDQIMLYLVVSGTYVTTQAIADALHMSRSFVEKRVAELRRDPSARVRIKSERRLGLAFDGSPYDRAVAFSELMMPRIAGIDYLAELSHAEEDGIPVLKGITRERLQDAVALAQDLRRDANESLTDDSYRQLLIHITFLLRPGAPGAGDPAASPAAARRLASDFQLNGSLTQLATMPDALPYRTRIEHAAAQHGLAFTESQLRLLTGIMASARKSRKLDIDAVAQDMDGFVLDALADINAAMAVDLRSDQALRQGLALHIYTTVVRRDSIDMVLDPYQEQEIKHQYPLGFEMATRAADLIRERYDYLPSETEIIYLALHFQVAIERLTLNERRVSAVVVCHYGQAAANLIAGKLERLFPLLEIKEIQSIQDFLAEAPAVDLVLATERVPVRDAAVIYVSPALRANEIDAIRAFMEDRKADDMIIKRIRESEVIDVTGCRTREEVINRLVDRLEALGAAGPDYRESVLAREAISPTNLNHIAVPHGNPALLREAHLVIGRTRDDIPWGDARVGCVFLFACDTCILQERATVFSKFYRRLASLDKQGTIDDLKGVSAGLFRQRLVSIMTETKGRNI